MKRPKQWLYSIVGMAMFHNVIGTAVGTPPTMSGTRSPMGSYKDFLSDPPPIKYMEFSLSGNRYAYASPQRGKIPVKGFVRLRGALYTNTWYLEKLDNFPESLNGMMGNGAVAGQFDKGTWTVEANKRVVRFGPRLIGRPRQSIQGPRMRAYEAKRDLRDVRALGLGHAMPGTIEWETRLSFKGESWTGRMIDGQITSVTNNRPARLQYTIAGKPNEYHSVKYEYDEDFSLPPSTTIIEVVKNGATIHALTNVIHKIEISARDHPSVVFNPCSFRPQTTPVAKFILWTNGVRTVYTPSGHVGKEEKHNTQPEHFLFAASIAFFIVPLVGGIIASLRPSKHIGYTHTYTKRKD